MTELSLALPVDCCHSDLIGGVGLQPRQHHGRWGETRLENMTTQDLMYVISVILDIFIRTMCTEKIVGFCLECFIISDK